MLDISPITGKDESIKGPEGGGGGGVSLIKLYQCLECQGEKPSERYRGGGKMELSRVQPCSAAAVIPSQSNKLPTLWQTTAWKVCLLTSSFSLFSVHTSDSV